MASETWHGYRDKKHFSRSPLEGVRVLELCTLILGPAGPGFLASMGAEVIKCELPPLGDTCRNLVPYASLFRDQGPAFVHANANKYWIGLDLHKPEAQKIFHELAAQSDIIEENQRPGVMESWNIGYRQIREINPRIIYISKNGFGQWGPYADENRPSNDGASQAFSGYSWLSSFPGRPPLKGRLYLCDNYGALMGELAVLAALHHRERTGKGQYIELSQTESIMRLMSWVWPYQKITGTVALPSGNRDISICPANTVYSSDGAFVSLAAPAPDEFRGLCVAMGSPELADDIRFRDHGMRLQKENADEIERRIAQWARTKTCREIESLAEKHGFAATRVWTTKDLIENEHLRERGFITEIDDPVLGRFSTYEFPVMMSESAPKKKWSVRPIGFDNEYVLTQYLGKSQEEIQNLYGCGALGRWADMPGRRPPPSWDGASGLILSKDLPALPSRSLPPEPKKARKEGEPDVRQSDWAAWARERDDPRIAHTKPEALDDITVLDLSYKSYAGSYCSSMLSEFGARVLRIEPPEGDFLRSCTPGGLLYHGEGLNYLVEGRNKFHVTLNLNKPEGRELLQNLARRADVLIETFKPGIMESWGIGYEKLKAVNPNLIFASLSARGQFGPLSRDPMPDYDNIAQARSGIQWATGEIMPENKSYDDCPWAVPTKAGPWVAWGLSGTFMALGILAALHYRRAHGTGQALDISTAEAYACFDDYALLYYQETGKINERFGNLDVAGWLYCFAPTKDGIVFLGALRLEMWQAFADMLGKWDEWDAGHWKNMIPFTAIDQQLKWSRLVFAETQKYTNQQLVNMAIEYGKKGRLAPITAVVAPVCSPLEAMNDPHWTARGMFNTIQDPLYGEIALGQAQHKMTETPARTKWACRPVGYDNEHIYLKYLGIGPTRLKRLKETGVI